MCIAEARFRFSFLLLPELDTSKYEWMEEAANKTSYTPSFLIHPRALALADSWRTLDQHHDSVEAITHTTPPRKADPGF